MHIRITQDSFEENVRWLEVSHNGSAWSTVRIQNDDEALQIANALQQSVQSDGACAHAKLEAYEFGYYCKDCGMANPPRH